VRVGLDEFADGEAICGLGRRNGDVFAHRLVSPSDLFRRSESGFCRVSWSTREMGAPVNAGNAACR
jgi:hypothetical protein